MTKSTYRGFRIRIGQCAVYVRPVKSAQFKDVRVFDTLDEAIDWIDRQNIRLIRVVCQNTLRIQ